MSNLRKMLQVFVANKDINIAKQVQKLLSNEHVVALELTASGCLQPEDKLTVEEKAEVLLAEVPILLDVVHSAKHLQWAASTWAGVEMLFKKLDPKKPPSCIMTRMGGAYNQVMGEYVIGYIIASERGMLDMAKQQHNKDFIGLKEKYSNYRCLRELTVGIIGVGEIGKGVAEMCHGLGMRVIGVTRSPPQSPSPAVSQYKLFTEVDYVLENSDYVVNILPSTPQTQGLLSGEVFKHCQHKRSVFINIGRGDVTDEESIIKAVNSGWLRGAVLDVFQTEPLPPSSALWSTPGITLTPHVSGVSLPLLVAQAFRDNFLLFKEGKPLKFVIDLTRGY